MEINCDRLISLVQQRRSLFDLKCAEYSDKNAKAKLWEEVYAEMIENWSSLDVNQKMQQGKRIQKRWNSLRDCFRRELAAQKKTTSGSAAKKRRKYIYFDQLLFLLPYTKIETESSLDNEEENNADLLATHTPEQDLHTDSIQDLAAVPPSSTSSTFNTVGKRKKKRTVDDEILNVLKEGNNLIAKENRNVKDDDESFLLSLLPSFKKYDYEQKMMLRMDIMNTVINFSRANPHKAVSNNIPPAQNISQTWSTRYQQPHEVRRQNSFGVDVASQNNSSWLSQSAMQYTTLTNVPVCSPPAPSPATLDSSEFEGVSSPTYLASPNSMHSDQSDSYE